MNRNRFGVLLAVIAGLALLVLAGFALPRVAVVERADQIAAPPATVYALLTDLRAARRWSPWRDARSRYLFSGPALGVGARMDWSGRSRGSSVVETANPYSLVVQREVFNGRPQRSAFRLTPTAQGAAVQWRLERDAGDDPVARWDNLLFGWQAGGDLERGLDRLEDVAEALPHTDMAAFDVRLTTLPGAPFAFVGGETAQQPRAVGLALTRSTRRVRDALRRAGLTPDGGPVWVAEPSREAGRLRFRAGYKLTGAAPAALPGVEVGRSLDGPAVEATHVGAYDAAPQAEAAARLFRGIHQLASAGPTWVEFSADPAGAPADALTSRFLLPVRAPGV